MKIGAHLPLIDFHGEGYALDTLLSFADAARELGYSSLTSNDHMVFSKPWLDGLTALAAVLPRTGSMTLMTSIALAVIRGPVQAAKTLAAIDLLSGGRLVVGVGPGSSRLDYAAVGLDFEERWKRLDDAVMALRALWSGSEHGGHYYSTEGFDLAPRPAREGGPPIWIGSWGSEAGLRRTARLADGWLASAYNTTPSHFQESWQRLREMLPSAGKEPEGYPNALATMWTFVTESREEQQRFLSDVLGRMLNRDPLDLAQRIAVGPAEECAERLREYRDAGVQQVLIWPVGDPVRQLERFKKDVEPLVSK